jgi:XTP/dITP diphosphohydrolase
MQLQQQQMIIFASKNLSKFAETKAVLQNFSVELIFMPSFIDEPVEIGASFQANAILKAYHTAQYVDYPVIADDSGLEIDALNGEPGIFSSRYAGQNASNKDNIKKVLAQLKTVPKSQRTARFHCVAVYVRNFKDPNPIIAHATWEGSILFGEQGTHGFGYDPIFYVPTHNCSAAELPTEIKNQISHRKQALKLLYSCLH